MRKMYTQNNYVPYKSIIPPQAIIHSGISALSTMRGGHEFIFTLMLVKMDFKIPTTAQVHFAIIKLCTLRHSSHMICKPILSQSLHKYCNGVEWSKDKTQAAESIKWRHSGKGISRVGCCGLGRVSLNLLWSRVAPLILLSQRQSCTGVASSTG